MDENTIKLFQSKNSDEWETPDDLFWKLHEEFQFNVDVCASKENSKLVNYYSIKEDALKQRWHGNCWCNPPYSKVKEFLIKTSEELKSGFVKTVVVLTFANTDTKWFHDYVYGKAEIRFIKGRLRFRGKNKEGKMVNNSAMRPSMLCIFRGTLKK